MSSAISESTSAQGPGGVLRGKGICRKCAGLDPAAAEAAFWADTASPAERKAYCLATFNRMPLNEQMAFLDYVQGRSAA